MQPSNRYCPIGFHGCARKPATLSPRTSPPFGRKWPCTENLASLVRFVARACNAFVMPTTRQIIARLARQTANFWPTARFRCCSRKIGQKPPKHLRKCALARAGEHGLNLTEVSLKNLRSGNFVKLPSQGAKPC